MVTDEPFNGGVEGVSLVEPCWSPWSYYWLNTENCSGYKLLFGCVQKQRQFTPKFDLYLNLVFLYCLGIFYNLFKTSIPLFYPPDRIHSSCQVATTLHIFLVWSCDLTDRRDVYILLVCHVYQVSSSLLHQHG